MPNGIGRSQILNAMVEKYYEESTSTHTEEENTGNNSEHAEIRLISYEKTNLFAFNTIGCKRFQ